MNRPQAPSWFQRNWKWLAAVACVFMLAIVAGFVFAVMMFVLRLMQSSGSYTQALVRARQAPALLEKLGTPIDAGLLMSGNISEKDDTGIANLAIPLAGPKGEGTLHVRATKSSGVWTFSRLDVEMKATKQRIDLLEGGH
jgi:cytochrome oxidase complex assembly protein 1